MGLFTASKDDAKQTLNEVNEFPLFVGEYTGNKKIIDSKIVFNSSKSDTYQNCIKELIKYAKDLEYDAITNIEFNRSSNPVGVFGYGNMVKFG